MWSVVIVHFGVMMASATAGFLSFKPPEKEWEKIQVLMVDQNLVESTELEDTVGRQLDDNTLLPDESTESSDQDSDTAPESSEPEQSAWRLRTPEEIKQTQLSPSKRSDSSSSSSRDSEPTNSAQEIRDRAKNRIQKINLTVEIPGAAEGQSEVSNNVARKYGNALYSLFKRRWEEPSTSVVPPDERIVKMRLVISRNGHLRRASFSERSGSMLMDQSVQKLFRESFNLPAPSDYGISRDPFIITVTFKLE